MTSSAVHNSDHAVGTMSCLPAAAEAPPARDGEAMATDIGSIDDQESIVAVGHTGNGAATASNVVAVSAVCAAMCSATIQPSTPDTKNCEAPNNLTNPAPTEAEEFTSNQIIASNNTLGSEPLCATVASTAPVPTYYPPRRPNIFRARAKNLRFPDCDRNPIASDAVGKSEGAMEDDGEDFSLADLEELQSDSKQKMEKKTERFVRMVQQTVWRSRVEDLGSVQEIEE